MVVFFYNVLPKYSDCNRVSESSFQKSLFTFDTK